jgi:chemosensory pili system protein ChpA (sensor histidine kinase/response regulator)
VDPELLEIFLEEGIEILDETDSLMQRLRASPADREPVTELQRGLHTLKGGARMAGLSGVGELSHVLESLFEAVADGRVEASEPTLKRIEIALDRIHADVERAQRGENPPVPTDAIREVQAMLGRRGEVEAGEVSGFEQDAASAEDETESGEPGGRVVKFPEREQEPEQQKRAGAASGQAEAVRVRSELLDNLVNYAGEVSIYRARLEQQVGSFRFNLVELEQTVSRLRDQLRKLEIETETQILSRLQREGAIDPDADITDLADFDPLELDRFSQLQQYSRALAESVADLVSIENMLSEITRESETLLLQQSRVNSDLQEGLMRTRMVPFNSLVPRLRRLVRRTARELDRKARLEVHGAEGEMDRNVLERMTAPLEHMLRNSLSHGIEPPQERVDAGKPEEGTIHIDVTREASEVVVRVSDDGRGIDLERVRETAIKRGLLKQDAELTDRDTLGFILETGFSTAESVSQVAGRGVGMDVVHAEIKQLSGSLDINSHTGQGTTFTIRLPFTLAVTQALMVRVGEDSYAVPLSGIEGVVRVPREEFMHLLEEDEATYEYAGEEYHVQDLAVLLGREPQHATEDRHVPVLIVRSGDQRAAIRVDELLGSREVVVKTVGPQLSTVPGIFGATILGDGSVVLILDLMPLVRRGAALRMLPEEMRAAREEVEEDLRPTIMVVDDSITMRKVTSRILERHDMQVMTAKDGVDAVAMLQENMPDLMLLDIEMPRMDGYELATHIRNDSRLKDLPIIMITSRTGTKHRERAEDIGVNKYLGKPYQETDLMEHINELLDEERHAG